MKLFHNFGAGNKNMPTDIYRPAYHFTPPANWLNDPNGLVYLDGEYHLFYQYFPHGIKWGAMHWGHAVSTDLIHWEHLPIALYPDKLGTIFSGSAVVDKNNSADCSNGENNTMVSVFTHFKFGLQRQSIAFSNDKGRSWNKYSANPVLRNPFRIHFRDPKVFMNKNSGNWIMVLACGNHVRLYSSPDLKQWELTGNFGLNEGALGSVWECPDLFEMEVSNEPGVKKWVMLVSIKQEAPNGGSGTQYFTGNFDGKQFINDNPPDTVYWLDYGKDNYAGVTWNNIPENDGRRIFIGWMNNWQYARALPTFPWRGAMTIPRELRLYKSEKSYRISSTPVKELEKIRIKDQEINNCVVNGNFIITRSDMNASNAFEIVTSVDMQDSSGISVELSCGNVTSTLTFHKTEGLLSFSRKYEGSKQLSRHFNGDHFAPVNFSSGKIELNILIDNCSVEIFVNDGAVCMTELIFPDGRIDSVRISSSDAPVTIEHLHLNELIY